MTTAIDLDAFIQRRIALARKALSDQTLIMNHICIRVPNMEQTVNLLNESFGINEFVTLEVEPGRVYPGEKKLSRTWIAEGIAIELMEPVETPRLDFSTGEGLPIGYLSEIGFFTPDLDMELKRLQELGWRVYGRCESPQARMVKIDTVPPSGIPVELIQVLDFEKCDS